MGTHALVLHPDLRQSTDAKRDAGALLEEAVGLAAAIELDVCSAQVISVHNPRPSTLLGSGQIERFTGLIEEETISVVIFNCTLSPVQQRNLEKEWKVKVIDRTALILEIFGARARTREGKLQVELAALEYQKSRLVRSWTHLERQRGGFGFLGGPGESQIETDRRLIRERIAALKKQLDKVTRTRTLHRKVRQDAPYPLIALVGYTNAGKSTLFNRLTDAGTYAADALFATLDPVIRKVTLPSGQTIMLSDTVGFISHLPTQLIAAFRATLEEVLEADLLLHVRDISHPDTEAQQADVQGVLKELLGAQEGIQQLEVWNKIDQIDEIPSAIGQDAPVHCAVSALTGEGVPELLDTVDALLRDRLQQRRLYRLPATAGKALAWLHSHGEVMEQREEQGVLSLQVALSPVNTARFEKLFSGEMAAV